MASPKWANGTRKDSNGENPIVREKNGEVQYQTDPGVDRESESVFRGEDKSKHSMAYLTGFGQPSSTNNTKSIIS